MKKGLILTAAVLVMMSFAVGCKKTTEDVESDFHSTESTVSDVVSKSENVVSDAKDKTESVVSDAKDKTQSMISDIISNMK